MDNERFDWLARGLAGGGRSRRGLLAGLAGAGLAAAVGPAALDEVAAKKKKKKNVCKNKPAVGGTTCDNAEPSICGPVNETEICICVDTAKGGKACVNLFGAQCPTTDECNKSKDCGNGQVCVNVAACCSGSPNNLCAPKCSDPSANPPPPPTATRAGGRSLLRGR
jgi:hypothetical protein